MHHLMPSVGGWFQDVETGVIFEVVAVDPMSETVEIQFRDGDLDEYDLETWNSLHLQGLSESKDCRDVFEMNPEDGPADDDILHPVNWSGILNELEPLDTLSWAEP